MLVKQAIDISFAKGLDLKTDPWRVALGNFLRLQNQVYLKGGRLDKRNGYEELTSLPDTTYSYVTTLNGNLTAIGPSIAAYNEGPQTWVVKGSLSPMEVSTLPLINNSLNQIQVDTAISSNDLICTVYSEQNDSTIVYKYAIADVVTGQNIVAPTLIPAAGGGTITGSPRVFLLGNYFVIVFTNVITATPHLQYICISSSSPTISTTPQDIASAYVSASTVAWDGVVTNTTLYLAYNSTTGGQSIKITYLTPQAAIAGAPPATAVSFTGATRIATMMTLCADESNPNFTQIYVSYYDAASDDGFTLSVDLNLVTVFAPVQIITNEEVLNLASAAQNNSCRVFYEVDNDYSYAAIPTHYVAARDISNAGTPGVAFISIRSVGLGSKAFIINETIYYLAAFESDFQPTYFLMNGSESTEDSPVISAKLAYENGGGYLTLGLPSVSVVGNIAKVSYLFKNLIQALTTVGDSQQTTEGGVYSQTGLKLGSFEIGTMRTDGTITIDSAQTAQSLHLSGGFLWQYDGYSPVEHNFFLWPDDIEAVASATTGAMTAQEYFYQAVYEWSDNQGLIHRSAPSIPVSVTLTTDDSVDISVPTLRLTYKIANPLKIVIYRWSTGQQTYHQVTSIMAPVLNDTTADSVTFNDKLSDAQIQGNNIIYTTGGVLENVNAPATNIMALFDNRLWLVDAENPNVLWYSKQIIQGVPVEMSDLLTYYVSPTSGSEENTGPMKSLAPMDDKIIIGKQNAFNYINGTGPDNTGANSQYSQPIFITATVGCDNQQSFVLQPQGLMSQSDKGIWLLDRGLATSYIGAPVDDFNGSVVQSAVSVPETNQVRFTLSTGETLMYDYYYDQWGTFKGVPAISSCIYQGLHTYINEFGAVFQEKPGSYLDGTNPVLIGFDTSWINVAGLQGYERAYFFYFLGRYLSPHKLYLQIAYDYNPSPEQSLLVTPDNFSSSDPSPAGVPTPFGATTDVEDGRIFLKKQRCKAFRISLDEVYDASLGVVAGGGFTLSGLNLVVAVKKGFNPISAAKSAG